MCYAIPGKVIEIKDKIAIIDYFGEKKKAINELDSLKIGDYIYAQGGYIIKVLPKEEALSILATWKETFFELQELDLRLSRLKLEEKGIEKKLLSILDRAAEDLPLKEKDLFYLLSQTNEKGLALLFKVANFLRQKHISNSCCVHGIIEFSNYCSQACHYCGIAKQNKKVQRYRMNKKEIVETACEAVTKYGFQALVLQSGEDPHYKVEDLCDVIREIKNRVAALIFISAGEVGLPGLKQLHAAGARGLLMRFETSNPNIYKKIHPNRSLDTRIAHLREAYSLGYLIITGGLIGLPGQTQKDLLNDIILAKNLHAEMYSFGPFLPHPNTPLGKTPPPNIKEILKILAVCRLADAKNAKIVVTTGFETLYAKAREEGLMAGANSVMLNVTPEKYSKDYAIYPNRAHNNEKISVQIEETLELLRSLGRAPTDLGIS